jgi:hypothetical protein
MPKKIKKKKSFGLSERAGIKMSAVIIEFAEPLHAGIYLCCPQTNTKNKSMH